MISRDEQRAKAIDHLAAHLLRTGLAETSLRQLAAVAGVSDRMLLYYFRDKTEVLAAAMERNAADLAALLATAIPEGALLSISELIGAAAAFTTADATRPYMRLWIEVIGAAARGEAPFVEIAQAIVAGFLQWIEAHLAPDAFEDPESRRTASAAVLAFIDGLAFLEIGVGPALTRDAARLMSRLTGQGERT
jgi:AcrR family transcriptional regulator